MTPTSVKSGVLNINFAHYAGFFLNHDDRIFYTVIIASKEPIANTILSKGSGTP